MNGKIKDLVLGVCTLVEVGCIIGLAGLGFKRNNDWYKAECELINTQCELYNAEIQNIVKDSKIKQMENEIKQLKAKYEEES